MHLRQFMQEIGETYRFFLSIHVWTNFHPPWFVYCPGKKLNNKISRMVILELLMPINRCNLCMSWQSLQSFFLRCVQCWHFHGKLNFNFHQPNSLFDYFTRHFSLFSILMQMSKQIKTLLKTLQCYIPKRTASSLQGETCFYVFQANQTKMQKL